LDHPLTWEDGHDKKLGMHTAFSGWFIKIDIIEAGHLDTTDLTWRTS